MVICLQCGRPRFEPWVDKIPWRREWQPTPVLLPGEFHGQRSLAGPSPWGHKESDTTEQITYTLTVYHVVERIHQTPNSLILPSTHLKHSSFSNFTIITKPQLFQLQDHLSSELTQASIRVDSTFILIHPKLHAKSRSYCFALIINKIVLLPTLNSDSMASKWP